MNDPDRLSERLLERDYTKEKILENVQAEILGNCVNYFKQKQLKVPLLEIDTSELTIGTLAQIIIDIITENINIERFSVGKIDWLEKLFQENRLNQYFD